MAYLKSCVLFGLAFSAALEAQTSVRFHTNLGDMDVTFATTTPNTVANFLSYMNGGTYTNTVFHRAVTVATGSIGIIQGGGYQLTANPPVQAAVNAPINSEAGLSNVAGTIATALTGDSSTTTGTDVNSATDQWFFNTVDNSATLDAGKYTVFGSLPNNPSLTVMNAIAAVPIYSIAGYPDFSAIPLINYKSSIKTSNYVVVTSIEPVVPAATAAGFTDAASYAASSTTGISPGQLLTIFGNFLGPTVLNYLELDPNSGNLVTTLEGTKVTFNGLAAPVIYTSTGQISVVAPYGIAGSSTVNVVVSYLGITTATFTFPVATATPGIFTLNSSGKGDAAVVRNSDGSVVNARSPAKAGDVLQLYGEGYGATTAATALGDGAIVGATLPAPATPVVLLIDGAVTPTLYAGGAPSDVNGVLQVNFIVPKIAAGSHSVQLKSGSVTSPAGVSLATQ